MLTLAHPSSTRQYTWPWLPWLSLIWLIPIGAWLTAPARWRRPGTVLAAGLGLLAAATLASALLSPFSALSLPRVWPTLSGVALFWWLHGWLGDAAAAGRDRKLGLGLAGAAAVLAMASLVGWRWQSAGVSWLVRNDIPFGHSNYTAGALVLGLPWLVAAAWLARGLRRFAWSLAAAVAFAALLATSSRAGVAALVATGAMSLAVALICAPWPRSTKVIVTAAALALVIAAVFANPRLRELAQGNGWGETARQSNLQRSAMLEAGWQLGQQRPWLGWGPGSVPLMYPTVRATLPSSVDNVLQLHNTPAQVWATLGAPGLVALLLILVATGRQLVVVMRQPDAIGFTAGAALVGYGLFALTDHQLDLPFFTTVVVANLALLHRGTGANLAAVGGFRRNLIALVACALLVPLAQTARDLHARLAYDQALTALGENRLDATIAYLTQAADRAPYDPYYRHQLAGRLLAERATTTDAAKREQLSAAAAEQLRLSLASGCFQGFAHFNLAWLALESGAPRLAETHFRAAIALAPQRSGVWMGLGLALRAQGENAAAVRAFALGWVNDPTSATSPMWHKPELEIFRPSIAREASAVLDELAPAHPAAADIGRLWDWWDHGGPPPALAFTREAAAFSAALAAITQGDRLPAAAQGYAWGRLLQTWQTNAADFSALSPRDPAFAAALARRAGRHPAPDVHGFLAADAEGEDNLVAEIRPFRIGYGVLALHPDGPVLSDLTPKFRPRLVSAFASTVFPERGWLPARELLARLPAATSTP